MARAEPQPHYDIVIIGGGGHGLATAHYLAKVYGRKNIAVIEKGWIGGGNVGATPQSSARTILLDGNEPFYEFSLKLWEGLEQDLNYNAMVSQRGIMNLIHSMPSAMLYSARQCDDSQRCGCRYARPKRRSKQNTRF